MAGAGLDTTPQLVVLRWLLAPIKILSMLPQVSFLFLDWICGNTRKWLGLEMNRVMIIPNCRLTNNQLHYLFPCQKKLSTYILLLFHQTDFTSTTVMWSKWNFGYSGSYLFSLFQYSASNSEWFFDTTIFWYLKAWLCQCHLEHRRLGCCWKTPGCGQIDLYTEHIIWSN